MFCALSRTLSLMLLPHSDKLLFVFSFAVVTNAYVYPAELHTLCCAWFTCFSSLLNCGPFEVGDRVIFICEALVWGWRITDSDKHSLAASDLLDEWGNVCFAFSIVTPHSILTSNLAKGAEITVESWRMAKPLLDRKKWGSKSQEREVDGFSCILVELM